MFYTYVIAEGNKITNNTKRRKKGNSWGGGWGGLRAPVQQRRVVSPAENSVTPTSTTTGRRALAVGRQRCPQPPLHQAGHWWWFSMSWWRRVQGVEVAEEKWDHDGAAGVAGVDQPAQHCPPSLGGHRKLVEGGVQSPRWALYRVVFFHWPPP